MTTLERTLVDVLDAPRHGGGWEEIWRSLESVEFFDVDAVTDYALKLGSAVTVAKVGFFLEQHREELMLEESHLERLQRARTLPADVPGTRQARVGQASRPLEPRGTRTCAEPDVGRGHMNLTPQDISREVTSTGFGGEPLEKVFRLMALLDALNSHPFLKTRIALKGGTALNLFYFDVPRLSVDVDLNYIGAADRETMLAERPKLERAVQAVCSREGLTVRRMPSEHAGGKWRLTYVASTGGSGNLELDVNFMLRTPLWPPADRRVPSGRVLPGGSHLRARPSRARRGKAGGTARAGRQPRHLRRPSAPRALPISTPRGFGSGSSSTAASTGRTGGRCRPGTSRVTRRTRARDLVPMLRADLAPAREEVAAWLDRLVAECRERLAVVLPLRAHELEFLERLNGAGDIAPEVLSDDAAMQAIIRDHPGLRWKALNVRKAPRHRRRRRRGDRVA